jgi:hypothetical protein
MLRLLVSRQYAYTVGETAVLPGVFFFSLSCVCVAAFMAFTCMLEHLRYVGRQVRVRSTLNCSH